MRFTLRDGVKVGREISALRCTQVSTKKSATGFYLSFKLTQNMKHVPSMHCIKVVKVILSSLFTFFNLFSKLVKKTTGPCVLTILEVSDVNANLVIMARR